MLPLGVVIPTKNSMPYLPGHLEGVRAWQDLAPEIIVVDSFSTDGTVDYLKRNLTHPRVQFLSHPPGLYESWNFGLARVTQPYAYLATAGDVITRAGLETLLTTAQTLSADVVVSKPHFRRPDGRAADIQWPIDDIIASLQITEPRKLSKLEAVIFAAVHVNAALLGSSASNIYRTEVVRRFPFPAEFGTSGDGAWGLQHAAEIAWGVVPDKFSTFLLHPSNASAAEKQSWLDARRPDDVLRTSMAAWRCAGVISEQEQADAHWDELLTRLTAYIDAKRAFDQNRRSASPWIFNPRAWQNRWRRERCSRRLHELKRTALRRCAR